MNNFAQEHQKRFTSIADAQTNFSESMVSREETVTFYLKTSALGSNNADIIPEGALAHSEECSGQAGDTLYWSITRLNYVGNWESGYYKFDYTIKYDTTYAQEQELTKKYNEVMAGMDFNGKSEYEKVKMIHDYLCDNINYGDCVVSYV